MTVSIVPLAGPDLHAVAGCHLDPKRQVRKIPQPAWWDFFV